MIVLLLFLLHLLLLLLLFVIVPRRLAQCVTNLVLGLVVSDVRPLSGVGVLTHEARTRGRFPPDSFQNVHYDHPLVVFRSGGNVPGDAFLYQRPEHLVALCCLFVRFVCLFVALVVGLDLYRSKFVVRFVASFWFLYGNRSVVRWRVVCNPSCFRVWTCGGENQVV